MTFRSLITILFIATFWSHSHATESLFHRTFADGQAAYEQGDYATALAAFLDAAKLGSNAALHHNLGNTYAQLGDGGRAIAHFHKALALAPRNPDTKANLALMYQRLGRAAPEPTALTTLAQLLTVNSWTWLAIAAFWLLVFFSFFPRYLNWRPVATWSARIAASITLATGICALLGYHALSSLAVVTDNETPLRPSPSQHSQTIAFLQAGETLSIDGQHGEFIRATLRSGRSGWIHSTAIIPVWDDAQP